MIPLWTVSNSFQVASCTTLWLAIILFSPFKPGAKEATGSEITPTRPASKDPHSTFQQGVWSQAGKDLTVEIAMLWASTSLHDDPLDLPHSIHIGAIATRYLLLAAFVVFLMSA